VILPRAYVIVDYCFSPEHERRLGEIGFIALEKVQRTSPLGQDVSFMNLTSNTEAPRTFEAAGRTYNLILDRYFIPVPADPIVDTALCDYISPDYERHIAVERNLANIGRLLQCALTRFATTSCELAMLDFGCGTGLIVRALDALPIDVRNRLRVTGTDASPTMLKAAKHRGLHVVTLSEWSRLAVARFDIVICSYVLHFGLTVDQAQRLSQQLRPRGMIVGNFHKATAFQLRQLHDQFQKFGRSMVVDGGPQDNPIVVIL
jgi:SAM-dependent methyltransferase